MATFDITATHPEYDQYSSAWTLMRDAFDGEDSIKAKKETYLPMKSGIKAIEDEVAKQNAYNNYKERAEFPEIVAPTIRGSSGLIHSKQSSITVPTALEPLIEKATKDGQNIQQLHHNITAQILKSGRFGLLPGIDEAGNYHIASYTAECITNWDGSDYVVLNETGTKRDPITNKHETVKAYRECYLDNGGFVSRVWTAQKGANGKDEYIVGDEEIATIKGKNRLPIVPFVFVGSQDLSPSVDDLPLYGLAKLAVRAYRLDADYVNSLHMTSEPTPWVTGVSKEDAPTSIGAANLWVLPENGSAGMLEFQGAGISAQQAAIADTLERAILFGAQLFADRGNAAESGAAIKLRLGHTTATLRMIAIASAAALEKALRNIAIWEGLNPDEVTVEPNLDFIEAQLTPQEILALVSAWQSGGYSKLTLYENLQNGGVANPERTFDDEQELIEQEGPALGEIAEAE